ncbi:alpha/beta fold hydrolase [Poseidonocella sp. HB161398]|uniref:alpha/beta fold hydrolase n=1 Tax=Poseidonocella sp. HB161398 TaxID=2320855 RepID=UPI001108CAF5|nr:alpha/beta fold hydrolase [Poseidonocella sp. HB161398]
MRWFETGGRALRYGIRHGRGPYLVLIHEMGGSIESWEQVLAHLPPELGVVLPEMRGMGGSEKIAATPGFGEIAADVLALLDHLGLTAPVILSGCAVGGGVAVRFALDYPDRTAGLAPLGPAMDVAEAARAGVLALADRMAAEGMAAMEPALLDRTYPEAYRARNPGHFATLRGRWRGNDPVSFAHFFRMLAATDLLPLLPGLRCPVHFAAGSADVFRPPAYVEAAARRVAGARMTLLDAGHHAADHAPAAVAALLAGLAAELA